MRLTPRRRTLIALLVFSPLAYFFVGWTVHLLFNLLRAFRGNTYFGCGGGDVQLLDQFNGCDGASFRSGYAVVEILLMTVVTLAVAYGLARWVVLPIRQVADTVSRFGPNALGLRLRAAGPADETRQLADAIDAMLDRLAEGYEAQRRFASTASHELRTPLATQRALIEVSLSSALTEEQLELLSRQLLATNERNEKLVDGLLTLAETERGLMARAPLRLDRIVGEVVENSRRTAAERGLQLSAELAPLTVMGEEPLLDRLAGNLVSNAIKYNVPGGWVRVEVEPAGTLTVANSGPEVPPEVVPALFEPFRRLAGERLDSAAGVGLGLTIARSIVAAHGGAIEAWANPGGGLVVRVRLPTTRPVGT
ncbi:MAG TPA: HAMP domain-containing sensor histidine kinase [Jatrophihabitans sp.]|nr:HAMP domain-containing sensor histidine kinase [Jatrophihabitans sp.]